MTFLFLSGASCQSGVSWKNQYYTIHKTENWASDMYILRSLGGVTEPPVGLCQTFNRSTANLQALCGKSPQFMGLAPTSWLQIYTAMRHVCPHNLQLLQFYSIFIYNYLY